MLSHPGIFCDFQSDPDVRRFFLMLPSLGIVSEESWLFNEHSGTCQGVQPKLLPFDCNPVVIRGGEIVNAVNLYTRTKNMLAELP